MKIKIVFIGLYALFSLAAVFVYQQAKFFDGKLHIIFCDVGQGDGIFIRTPKGTDILIDGGPNEAILSCLSSYMPFWDREIELVMLTHPHADHLGGLISVFKRYKVASFVTEKLENDTASFRDLRAKVDQQKLSPRYLLAGSKVKVGDGVVLSIVGPTASFLQKSSPGGTIGERSEFASIETLVSYGAFSTLLTGDSQAEELQEAIDIGYLNDIDVLQVPHHGSKTGLTDKIIQTLYPKLAVISVGKNKYGHPAPKTLEILRDKNIRILRTDLPAGRQGERGDIEIVSDGKKFLLY